MRISGRFCGLRHSCMIKWNTSRVQMEERCCHSIHDLSELCGVKPNDCHGNEWRQLQLKRMNENRLLYRNSNAVIFFLLFCTQPYFVLLNSVPLVLWCGRLGLESGQGAGVAPVAYPSQGQEDSCTKKGTSESLEFEHCWHISRYFSLKLIFSSCPMLTSRTHTPGLSFPFSPVDIELQCQTKEQGAGARTSCTDLLTQFS